VESAAKIILTLISERGKITFRCMEIKPVGNPCLGNLLSNFGEAIIRDDGLPYWKEIIT